MIKGSFGKIRDCLFFILKWIVNHIPVPNDVVYKI